MTAVDVRAAERASIEDRTHAGAAATKYPGWHSRRLCDDINDAAGKWSAPIIEASSGQRTLNLLGVSRTGIVGVYLLRCRALVERHEPVQQICASGVVVVATIEIGEIVAEW